MLRIPAQEIPNYLPHRPPFLFVDEVTSIDNGISIRGLKKINLKDYYFQGHFPENPIMPGFLISEALAQVSCILYALTFPTQSKRDYYLSSSKIRFLNPVVPPGELHLNSEAIRMVERGGIFKVTAIFQSRVAAEGEMVFACHAK